MVYSQALLNSIVRHLQQVFGADGLQAHTEVELLHHLTRMVLHLLRHNLSHLLHILYRVDVEEHQVKRAMLEDTEEAVADSIARLILKRELQKAQIRFRYSQN
jgi:hypothetical protein